MNPGAEPSRAAGGLQGAAVVWLIWLELVLRLRRQPLPAVVAAAGRPGGLAARPPGSPRALGRLIWRRLRVAGWRPRCLPRALVLYRLLRARGVPAELVIGLTEHAQDRAAHAWVEVAGMDVGPPPGQAAHRELVRYPLS